MCDRLAKRTPSRVGQRRRWCQVALVAGQSGRRLERVDVLGEASEQQAFFLEQADEDVSRGRLVAARPQLLAQAVEGLRVATEELEVEDGLGVRQAILLHRARARTH